MFSCICINFLNNTRDQTCDQKTTASSSYKREGEYYRMLTVATFCDQPSTIRKSRVPSRPFSSEQLDDAHYKSLLPTKKASFEERTVCSRFEYICILDRGTNNLNCLHKDAPDISNAKDC